MDDYWKSSFRLNGDGILLQMTIVEGTKCLVKKGCYCKLKNIWVLLMTYWKRIQFWVLQDLAQPQKGCYCK